MPSLLSLLCLPLAVAGGPSGYAVPQVGGGLAGPTEAGALALPTTPAGVRPDRLEVVVDASLAWSDFSYQLDEPFAYPGEPDEPQQQGGSGWATVPFLGVAAPIGRWGVGASVMVPWSRGGGTGSPPDGLQRFHSVSGMYRVVEEDLALSWQPADWLTLGAAARLAEWWVSSSKAINTGALVYDLSGEEDLVTNSLFEGTQSFDAPMDTALGWAAGVGIEPRPDLALQLWTRSSLRAEIEGDLVMVPSNDLNMAIYGTVIHSARLPTTAGLALSVPLRHWILVGQLGWEGWSILQTMVSQPTDLRIGSSDPTMEAILAAYGIDEARFLQSTGESISPTGMKDIWPIELGARWQVREPWQARFGYARYPSTTPSALGNPGNMDFTTQDYQLGLVYSGGDWFRAGLSMDAYPRVYRVITDSQLSFVDAPDGVPRLPSGNGTYSLALFRLGLTWTQLF